jgi:sialate O-acetylesterase
MVLQRAPQKAIVWGFGDPGVLTTLTMDSKTYTTVSSSKSANELGETIWSVTLDPVSDEGPFDIHVSQPLANGTLVTITIHDVLFGDVWVCSGQSNMQFTVDMSFNGSQEIANAGNFSKIRLLTVSLIPAAVPVEELLGINQNWSVASPQSVGGPSWNYFSATCWYFGRMVHQALGGRPLGLIATSWGGTPVEFWSPPEALHDCNSTISGNVAMQPDDEVPVIRPNNEAPVNGPNHTDLFNAMIYPFTRTVIYGAIWYQGEANAGNPTYACKFARMIVRWREIWNNRTNGITDIQFPFGFVQLSTNTHNSTLVGGFPMLRWQQTFNVGYVPNNVVPKVFMAVALDLRDDPNGIHPRTKEDVGYRLSRSGLSVAYGQQVEFQGPIVQNVVYSSGASTVNITYTSVSSIELRNPSGGFEVCCGDASQCPDGSPWTLTNVASKSGLTVTVTVPSECVGKQLYGLRYLWRETPVPFKEAAVYSGTDANLPSPPYIKIF